MIVEKMGDYSVTTVSIMREGSEFGINAEQLQDGNTLSSLCLAAGEGACKNVCQIDQVDEYEPKICAEENIEFIAAEAGIVLDRLVIVPPTEDSVLFGDKINKGSDVPDSGMYQKTTPANAFFFRPGIDQTLSGQTMAGVGMRMADCGSVGFEFNDCDGALVIGQSHFSRTNMHPETEFDEELRIGGEPVSWAEHVLQSAIDHYGADIATIKIQLAAATEGKSFSFPTVEKFQKYWPGWIEKGFAEVVVNAAGSLDVIVGYRKMIDWQLKRAADRFGIDTGNILYEHAINTEDVRLGHASHQNARIGKIAHGRDLYVVGVDKTKVDAIETELVLAYENLDMFNSSASFEEADEANKNVAVLEKRLKQLRC